MARLGSGGDFRRRLPRGGCLGLVVGGVEGFEGFGEDVFIPLLGVTATWTSDDVAFVFRGSRRMLALVGWESRMVRTILLMGFASLFSTSSTSAVAAAARVGFASACITFFSSSSAFFWMFIWTIFLVKLLEFSVPPRIALGAAARSEASNASGSAAFYEIRWIVRCWNEINRELSCQLLCSL